MLRHYGQWSLHDAYRLPAAVCLWPVVAWNYRERRAGRARDTWHWADMKLAAWGYAVA